MTLPKPKDAMRGVLAGVLLSCFMLALFWVIQHEVPQSNSQLVTYMLGQLSVFTGMAVGFYFVTSKSSADKNEIMGDALLQPSGPQDVHVVNPPADPVPTNEATSPARTPLTLDESMEAPK